MNLTVRQLAEILTRLAEIKPDASVTYGPAAEPVTGGILAHNQETGEFTLNLAPVQLDRVGGF